MKIDEANKFMQQVHYAIDKCIWRKEVHGVDICTGMAQPCVKIIDKGECDTIKRLFEVEE